MYLVPRRSTARGVSGFRRCAPGLGTDSVQLILFNFCFKLAKDGFANRWFFQLFLTLPPPSISLNRLSTHLANSNTSVVLSFASLSLWWIKPRFHLYV